MQHIEYEHGYLVARREICEFLKSLAKNKTYKFNRDSLVSMCNLIEQNDFKHIK